MESPALRASSALQATVKNHEDEDSRSVNPDAPRPIVSSGFTPVNVGGFTAVNARPASTSFSPVNGTNGVHRDLENGCPSSLRSAEVSPSQAKHGHADEHREASARPSSQAMKRQRSDEGDGEAAAEGDAAGRRSKRLRKGQFLVSSCKS